MKCRERGERRRKGRHNSWEAGRGGGSACARLSGKERTHEAGPHECIFIFKEGILQTLSGSPPSTTHANYMVQTLINTSAS